MLTLPAPQADTSSLSGDNTLMSTLEEKETDGEQGPTASPAPAAEASSLLQLLLILGSGSMRTFQAQAT